MRETEIWFADEGAHQPDEKEQARQTTRERQVHRITRALGGSK
jgi:hypothetical protein